MEKRIRLGIMIMRVFSIILCFGSIVILFIAKQSYSVSLQSGIQTTFWLVGFAAAGIALGISSLLFQLLVLRKGSGKYETATINE